jgi:hypothetical protein
MTAQILQMTPFAALVAPMLRTACRRFLGALEAFAAAKTRNAVPEHELRRAEREIDHYRQLMHPVRKLPAKSATGGR